MLLPAIHHRLDEPISNPGLALPTSPAACPVTPRLRPPSHLPPGPSRRWPTLCCRPPPRCTCSSTTRGCWRRGPSPSQPTASSCGYRQLVANPQPMTHPRCVEAYKLHLCAPQYMSNSGTSRARTEEGYGTNSCTEACSTGRRALHPSALRPVLQHARHQLLRPAVPDAAAAAASAGQRPLARGQRGIFRRGVRQGALGRPQVRRQGPWVGGSVRVPTAAGLAHRKAVSGRTILLPAESSGLSHVCCSGASDPRMQPATLGPPLLLMQTLPALVILVRPSRPHPQGRGPGQQRPGGVRRLQAVPHHGLPGPQPPPAGHRRGRVPRAPGWVGMWTGWERGMRQRWVALNPIRTVTESRCRAMVELKQQQAAGEQTPRLTFRTSGLPFPRHRVQPRRGQVRQTLLCQRHRLPQRAAARPERATRSAGAPVRSLGASTAGWAGNGAWVGSGVGEAARRCTHLLRLRTTPALLARCTAVAASAGTPSCDHGRPDHRLPSSACQALSCGPALCCRTARGGGAARLGARPHTCRTVRQTL